MSPLEMISRSSVAAVISDPTLPDTPIVACNDAFSALTGYAAEEVIGRNCRFLRGLDTELHLTEELRCAVRDRRTTLVEILNYRKDGSPFRNAVMLAPIFEADGASVRRDRRATDDGRALRDRAPVVAPARRAAVHDRGADEQADRL